LIHKIRQILTPFRPLLEILTWAQNHIIARNEYDSTGNVTGVDYIEVNKGPTTASGGYPFDIVLFQALEVRI
jgi:hypothetical protein